MEGGLREGERERKRINKKREDRQHAHVRGAVLQCPTVETARPRESRPRGSGTASALMPLSKPTQLRPRGTAAADPI